MSLWFPPKGRVKQSEFIEVVDISDFDVVTDMFPGPQQRVQLDAGCYEGKIMSADFGRVTLMQETGNRAFELEADAAPHLFGLSVVLEQPHKAIYLGNEVGMDDVSVIPNYSILHAVDPSRAVVAVVLVECDALFSHPHLSPEAGDWLLGLERHGTVIHAPWLANRLRDDIQIGLKCLLDVQTAEEKALLDKTMLGCIVSALSMEFLRRRAEDANRKPRHFETFWSMRAALQLIEGKLPEPQALLDPGLSMSRRTIETVFSNMVGLPPVKYHQIYRLNRTRQKIRDLQHINDSIGDIAAEEGFWDWSRFSSYYRKHFGERPSETRKKFSFSNAPERQR